MSGQRSRKGKESAVSSSHYDASREVDAGQVSSSVDSGFHDTRTQPDAGSDEGVKLPSFREVLAQTQTVTVPQMSSYMSVDTYDDRTQTGPKSNERPSLPSLREVFDLGASDPLHPRNISSAYASQPHGSHAHPQSSYQVQQGPQSSSHASAPQHDSYHAQFSHAQSSHAQTAQTGQGSLPQQAYAPQSLQHTAMPFRSRDNSAQQVIHNVPSHAMYRPLHPPQTHQYTASQPVLHPPTVEQPSQISQPTLAESLEVAQQDRTQQGVRRARDDKKENSLNIRWAPYRPPSPLPSREPEETETPLAQSQQAHDHSERPEGSQGAAGPSTAVEGWTNTNERLRGAYSGNIWECCDCYKNGRSARSPHWEKVCGYKSLREGVWFICTHKHCKDCDRLKKQRRQQIFAEEDAFKRPG